MQFEHTTQEVKITKNVISIDLYNVYILDRVDTLSGETMLLWDSDDGSWAIMNKFIDFSDGGDAILFEDCPNPYKTKDQREAMKKWIDYVGKWSK